METYKDRIQTFENWSSDFSKHILAKAGFVYTGRDDIVICPFCHVEGFKWIKITDDPFLDHLRWSPNCKFVKEKLFNVRRTEPRYANMITIHQRINSFIDWPISLSQKPEDLADAGFFYSGRGDTIICFHCGYAFKDWLPTSDIWEEHARYQDRCNFFNLRTQISESKSTTTTTTTENKIEEDDQENINVCKICLKNEPCVVFLPCKHFLSCTNCSLLTSKCFICRKPIESLLKIFMS